MPRPRAEHAHHREHVPRGTQATWVPPTAWHTSHVPRPRQDTRTTLNQLLAQSQLSERCQGDVIAYPSTGSSSTHVTELAIGPRHSRRSCLVSGVCLQPQVQGNISACRRSPHIMWLSHITACDRIETVYRNRHLHHRQPSSAIRPRMLLGIKPSCLPRCRL